ncbi:uncharacterized protein LOC111832427 [Capsella rubella]|uniref:uncharacterized protein LOC111832427 n=1 Tax=Capsella rubella TaxID=81985 RepID=UPI000CD4ED45|nr:uncharacterized protein LOC111832427 [Capsella rubella]
MLTRVWFDPWIPTIPPRPAKSIGAFRDPHLYVNDLLDRDTQEWKLNNLQTLVDPADIPLILGIRPSRTYLSDGYSWVHTKSGNYTVKSGYWAARMLSRPSCDPPFQGPGMMFPRQSLFFNFDFLLWSGRELKLDASATQDFPWILWYIWKARNRFMFENIRESPMETLLLATQEAAVWRRAMEAEDLAVRPPPAPPTTTPSPPSNIPLECQCDASWFDSDSFSGLGWVLVDGSVRPPGGHSWLGLKCVRRSISPLHAEFDALLWAMECMVEIGMNSACFATDCSDLLAILESPPDWPTFAAEYASFRDLKASFPVFRIRRIPRKDNRRADYLAKKARSRGVQFSLTSTSAPSWLSLEESSFR